jgi:hypothetical protein
MMMVLRGDGGDKVPALTRPLSGRSRVAHALPAWASQGLRAGHARVQQVEVNGEPGALMCDGAGRLIGVMALDIADGRVRAVSSIVNPDKLRHLGPIGDLRGLLKRVR